MHPLPFPYPCPCPSQVLSAKDDGLTASDEAAVEALYAGVAQAHIEALGLEAQALLAQARQGQGQGQGRAVEEADPRQPSLSLASTSTSEYFGLLYTRSAASRAPLDAILHCLCTDPNPLYRSGAREWVNELCQDIARRVSVPGMHHKVRGLGGPRGEGPAPLATMACLHADLAHSNIPPPPPRPQTAPLKGRARAMTKTRLSYDGDYACLRDVVRGELVYTDLPSMADGLRRLGRLMASGLGEEQAQGAGGIRFSLVRLKNRCVCLRRAQASS